MRHSLPATFGRFNTGRPSSAQAKDTNTPLYPVHTGASGSLDGRARLSQLLAKIRVYGVPYYEQEIDQIRTLDNLSESEREIVLEIFRYAHEAAEKERRQDKMWVYQRLLRRLLLHQPLDQPIPLNNPLEEIPPEMTGHVAEPSATQQSLKQVEPSPRDGRRPGRWWLLKFAFYTIGAAALAWTAFAFRSPTDVRDAVVPVVRDNQRDATRGPAAQENGFEPEAHASALTRPAEIAPVAEGASEGTAEPAPISKVIVDEIATSSKSPATAKFEPSAQAAKIKWAAKVANQAATNVDTTGKIHEREPTIDSLPIYQTRRRILLREEPRFGAPSHTMLDTGARLIVLEINGPWLKVKMENTGAPGFVREEFVEPAAAAAPSSPIKNQNPP
jgi:hypothetical protein